MVAVIFNLLKVFALLPIFLLLSIFVFYTPGYLLINQARLKLRDDEKIVLSTGLGLIVFLIIAILFALLKVRFLVPFIYLGLTLYALYKFKNENFLPFARIFKQKLLMLFLLTGTLVEGFINFPSGFPFKEGYFYWSSQGHDGLWHVAIIEAIKKTFPPDNLLFAGEKFYNYHYFADIIEAEFSRIFPFFSILDLYFRYFPFIICLLIGLATYAFLTTWQKNKTVGLLGVFFTYFVGSFGYVVLLIQKRGFLGGETIFWASQLNTIIGNPPHAFCFILLPAFLLCFYHYLKKQSWALFAFCVLLGGFLLGFKISSAVVLLSGLGISSLLAYVFQKRKDLILLTISLGITNFIIFRAITRGNGPFLIFEPWWFIRTMVVAPDRLNWLDLELRRQFYLAKGGWRSTLRILEYESIAFLIFLLGNLGMRFIGFWGVSKNIFSKGFLKNPIVSVLLFGMVTAFLVPLFFLQNGIVSNLIQFMQYFLLFFGYFGAITLYAILKAIRPAVLKSLFLAIFIFFSIPTVVGNLFEFYNKPALTIVSNEEIEGLAQLKLLTNDSDIILTKPFNPYAHSLYKHQPWPIYAWDSTPYVSAYTARQTFYTDEGMLKQLHLPTEERLNAIKAFFDKDIPLETKADFIKDNHITFIYLRNEELDENLSLTLSKLKLKKIFSNSEVTIFRVENIMI